ncbi:MAG: hypothetical protein ACRCXM_04535 [Beijerinckiaceae bacterium]
MALGGITLSSGMRYALSSMSDLDDKINTANTRLATGKKVNTPMDNAASYFRAMNLTDRAKSFDVVADNISQSIQTISTATKALDRMKELMESAAGQLRNAIASPSTNAKATTAFSFTSLTDDFAPATGNATQFDDGDSIVVATYNHTSATTGTLTLALAGKNVGQVIDLINGDATLNPVGQPPRIRAYLSNGTSGNLIIEASDTNTSSTMAAGAGNASGMQINLTHAGVTQDLRQVFNFTGISTGATDATSNTASVRVYGTQNATRKAAFDAFNTTLDQIAQLAKDANYNGTNLLQGDALTTYFNADNTTFLRTNGSLINGTNLGFGTDRTKAAGITQPATGSSFDHTSSLTGKAFQSDAEVKSALAGITFGLSTTTAMSATLSNNLNIVKARQTYTKDYVKLHDEGADMLTAADMNAEGANLLALQTRQQMSVSAMSMASRSDQAILRLF